MKRANLLLISVLLAGCDSSPANEEPSTTATEQSTPEVNPADIEAAKKALKSEPKIRDLTYDPRDVVQWKIGVVDDGTDRIGYAGFICQVLAEHRIRMAGTKVRIISWQRITENRMFDDDANLGTIDCETGNRFGSART